VCGGGNQGQKGRPRCLGEQVYAHILGWGWDPAVILIQGWEHLEGGHRRLFGTELGFCDCPALHPLFKLVFIEFWLGLMCHSLAG
jgi:hypothetical protein